VVVVLVVLAVLLPQDEPERRERVYGAATACLLTDAQGVAGAKAAPVWAGMQQASSKSGVKVQWLEVVGEQTPANGVTFLGSLAQGKCDLVLAAGDVPVNSVVQGAAKFPKTRFLVVGPAADASRTSNVAVLPNGSDEAVRIAVSEQVGAIE
jgi:basic membrane lipoprotein Med (substrate-binding protein (PBP1-ABC) superfamily)